MPKTFNLLLLLILIPSFFLIGCNKNPGQFKYRQALKDWQISDGLNLKKQNNWLPVKLPATVLAALRQNGRFSDVFFGDNLKKVDPQPFKKSWYYRTTFSLPALSEFPFALLRFNGINYRANIWFNQRKIASADTVFGAFRLFEFNISDLLKERDNRLIVQVFPPQAGDFTIGFVDWNPAPPDNNMGLWRPVELIRSKAVCLKNVFVRAEFDSAFNQARLSVDVTVQNLSRQKISGRLIGKIGDIAFGKTIEILPEGRQLLTLDYEEFPQLVIKNPQLWWPHNFGEPKLHRLKLQFKSKGRVSDQIETTFGLRKIETYFTKEGYRGFKINGRNILIQGAGWSDDIFLADRPQKVRQQLRLVKEAHLNAIRLEGFWGNDQTLYNVCDSLGILILPGFSCQWEWTSYLGKACDRFGGARTEDDFRLLSAYWRDQILLLRHHPSVMAWLGGSDMLPRPELERRFLNILNEIDGTRPYIGSAALLRSEVSGPTGFKMNGPYDYVPPKYWYEDSTHGGAFGFNSETGPGPQPPPLSTLKMMLPKEHLWPIDSIWQYHCAGNQFNSLNRYVQALNKRYGPPEDVANFIKKAQAMNYEAMRPMFEAFAIHKFRSTGVILWMLNSAWPALYWQLYDYYLMPNGAYYGAKKACAPIQLSYNYKDHHVYLVNNSLTPHDYLMVTIRLFNSASRLMDEFRFTENIAANAVKRLLKINTQSVNSPVFFLDLRLTSAQNKIIARNFYWLAKQDDELDYKNSKWFVTPIKRFADFTSLERLPKAKIRINGAKYLQAGKHVLELKNTSQNIAFFVYLELQNEQGEPILPVFWEDNYLSLLPGERRKVKVAFYSGKKVKLVVNGWNLE